MIKSASNSKYNNRFMNFEFDALYYKFDNIQFNNSKT